MMKILAVDPSSTITGWAVMESPDKLLDMGFIDTKEVEYERRFKYITDRLHEVSLKWRVDAVACEMVVRFEGRRIPALEVVSLSIRKWSERNKIPLFQYSPATWKASAIGDARADKSQVTWLMQQHFPELANVETKGVEHVADAMGIGLHHLGVEKWVIMGLADRRHKKL